MYEVKDEVLCIVNTGAVAHQHHAVGTRIVQLLPLGANVVVLEDYYRFPPGHSNLYCLDRYLRPVWSAEMPSATDAYVGPLAERDGRLNCASWEGWFYTIDAATGQTLQRTFTK